jgi:hypothetical protein
MIFLRNRKCRTGVLGELADDSTLKKNYNEDDFYLGSVTFKLEHLEFDALAIYTFFAPLLALMEIIAILLCQDSCINKHVRLLIKIDGHVRQR